MEETEQISYGPWRATKLWNEIVRSFRSGMPLKKHRKGIKTYESCFTSSEAVEWLNRNLQKNTNFGSDVTKEQTVQLLRKLFRAGIIENVREDVLDDEFKETGELYRFSVKSPVKLLRTPNKNEKRQALGDVANTPLRKPRGTSAERMLKDENVKPRRSLSRERSKKDAESMKKQLNLSYFQALPVNSLILLDNDSTWQQVLERQLSVALSPHHVSILRAACELKMSNVTHNMTRVSAKGVVQVEDKTEDLPHWVLSAMKCLANWPKQLKTMSGKESCLPSYPGFQTDVFNVVKDYFLGLPGPLTTFPLYDFFVAAYVKAEAVSVKSMMPRREPPRHGSAQPGCHTHPGSGLRACTRPFTQTDLDCAATSTPRSQTDFYTMAERSDEFLLLSNQERVARIRQTFEVLPPLSSGVNTTNSSGNTNQSSGGCSSFEGSGVIGLSPDMSTTAIMRNFLPPNTCFETAFMEESPITRIVPQKENEVLHLQRSGSSRSYTHIPNSWSTRSIATQTQQDGRRSEESNSSSLKRLPKWRRHSRLRKSIAVMESPAQDENVAPKNSTAENDGIDNGGFVHSLSSENSIDEPSKRFRQLYSTGDLPNKSYRAKMRGFNSVDNLLNENNERDFMLKYRAVSGDLRGANFNDEVLSDQDERYDKSVISSKTVRKEKRKKKPKAQCQERKQNACYYNFGQDSPERSAADYTVPLAPLAVQEPDISPVPPPFYRQSKYNASYRMATNQLRVPPGTQNPQGHEEQEGRNLQSYQIKAGQPYIQPVHVQSTRRSYEHLLQESQQPLYVIPHHDHQQQQQQRLSRHNLPRTSTKISLPQPSQQSLPTALPGRRAAYNPYVSDDCLYVRAEPYMCINSDVSQSTNAEADHLYADLHSRNYPPRQHSRGAGPRGQEGVYNVQQHQQAARHVARQQQQQEDGRQLYADQEYRQSYDAYQEAVYTQVGAGPLKRYTVSGVRRSRHGLAGAPARPSMETASLDNLDTGIRRSGPGRASRSSQLTADSGAYSMFSRTSWHGRSRAASQSQSSPGAISARDDEELYFAPHSNGGSVPGSVSGSKMSPEGVRSAVASLQLLALLLPSHNRRKLQLLLKFIKKVINNPDLELDGGKSLEELTLGTFLEVIIRPADITVHDTNIAKHIVQFFLNHYDEIWTPPQSLRREVEERVYQSLVNKRLQAGEDPYPVTYCERKSVAQYEDEKLTGAQTALLDLLDAILSSRKLSKRDKRKKLGKFKESYPDLWRLKFPDEDTEPDVMNDTEKTSKTGKFSSLSKLKSAMRM